MFRPFPALFLLLGLASTGTAQAPSSAAWTLASGDFTVYGHTDYVPALIPIPRIVYDTAEEIAADGWSVDGRSVSVPAPIPEPLPGQENQS